MTVSLIYGQDAVGKSMHMVNICEAAENPLFISLELKNRRLLHLDNQTGEMTDDTPFKVIEPIVLEDVHNGKFNIDGVDTFNAFGIIVERILKENVRYDVIVVDSISLFDKWAEERILSDLQKKHPTRQAIGENDKASWADRNNLSCLPIEALANWSVISGSNIFLTTLMKSEYLNNVKTGYKVSAQDRIKEKACDVRVRLERSRSGEYRACFEKLPDWAEKQKSDEVPVGKGGLYAEYVKRGLL